MSAPLSAWLSKSVAALICYLSLALLWRRRHAGAPLIVLCSCALFFGGGAASATLGAIIEAALGDPRTGALFSAMLLATLLASAGAWNLGGCFLAAAADREPIEESLLLTRAGNQSLAVPLTSSPLTTRGRGNSRPPLPLAPPLLHMRILFWSVLVSAALFVASVALTFFTSSLIASMSEFDLCMSLASMGGIGLLIGAATCAYRRPHADARYSRAALACVFGVVLTGIGFALSSLWLSPLCSPPATPTAPPPNITTTAAAVGAFASGSVAHCPLPAWASPDTVYHSTLVLAYAAIAYGAHSFILLLEWAALANLPISVA